MLVDLLNSRGLRSECIIAPDYFSKLDHCCLVDLSILSGIFFCEVDTGKFCQIISNKMIDCVYHP